LGGGNASQGFFYLAQRIFVMGTDIHFYVERKEGAKWISCDTWEDDKYEPGNLIVPYRKYFYKNRNYDLFAILANVRNGRGFAGVETGEGFNCIAEPRGLPNDMSPELQNEARRFLDHTPSWLLLSEIMDFDWTQETSKYGMLNALEYAEWARYNKKYGYGPTSYSGDVWGVNVKKVHENVMAERIQEIAGGAHYQDFKDAIKTQLSNIYTRVCWKVTYARAAKDFLSEALPRLWRLGSFDKVRCVFWFDS
jgi:hypothetical protein